jgi:DNA adenine methylase
MLEHDDLQIEFYAAREVINQSWDCVDPLQRALAYIIVRQLCFSGMERYNAKGEFNVPFGHYKKFSCNLSSEHHAFLGGLCTVKNETFEGVFDEVKDTDFLFVDPPYLDRLVYTQGDGGLELHEGLLRCLKTTNAKWMVVHSDNEFYRDCYSEFCIVERDFAYAQRFGKGKDHSGAKVKHLYVTNYEVR